MLRSESNGSLAISFGDQWTAYNKMQFIINACTTAAWETN